jgi:hypothetical protein
MDTAYLKFRQKTAIGIFKNKIACDSLCAVKN